MMQKIFFHSLFRSVLRAAGGLGARRPKTGCDVQLYL